ncbi:MAG: glycosyltransferase [Bacteroidales bacterium]|nr:glycosyltransferase [Bacteroidales bacterium]
MRIAILSCFYPYRGGISQFNTCLLNELSKQHTVKAFNFKRQYPNFLFPGKTQFVTKEDNAVPVESEALLDTANPFSYISTAKKIREWRPDILIMRYWMSYFAPSLGYVAKHMDKSCKVISILDNVVPHEPRFFDKPFTGYFLNGQNGYVVLCDSVGNDLLKFKPQAKYLNTPHPLYSHFGEKLQREEAEAILGLKPGKKNLLFFGLIREYKGLDILLEAFNKLDGSYQLIIAGEPYGSFEKYRKLIDESPLKENISLNTNYIPDNLVNRYFSAADVCVLPYRSATQSGISSVSYHFEVPMITTNVGGLQQMIGDTGTGLISPSIDPDSIAGLIKEFFSSDRRSSLIENIRKEKERLSWSRFCNKLIDFAGTV